MMEGRNWWGAWGWDGMGRAAPPGEGGGGHQGQDLEEGDLPNGTQRSFFVKHKGEAKRSETARRGAAVSAATAAGEEAAAAPPGTSAIANAPMSSLPGLHPPSPERKQFVQGYCSSD
ncbi:hypothetical protein INR49_003479 [Caranx melampygus]|nr:hypothetical protein INR49_003479 [Caranx melampygus]